MKVSFTFLCALLLSGALNAARGQGWRGIVPLRSTCDDVRRILKISACDPVSVELDDAIVFVTYAAGPCQPEWNVAAGTVLTLDVRPRKDLRVADLKIDETKYSREVRQNTPRTVYLNNPMEGINIALFEDDRIRYIFYGPSTKDEHLRCSRLGSPQGGDVGPIPIDQYGFMSFKEEAPRLNEVVTALKQWPGGRVFIVVYPSQTTPLKEARMRAQRAKRYMMKKGISAGRVITMIGGRRKEPVVNLYLAPLLSAAPILSPPPK